MMLCCVLRAKDEHNSGMSDAELVANVRLQAFGDDNMIAHSELVRQLACQSEFTKQMKALFDYNYTDESKEDIQREDRSIFEVSYLKRAFRKVGNHYFAPLDLSVLKETLNWCRGANDISEFTLRMEAVATELSYHGKAVFDAHFPIIERAAYDLMDYRIVSNTFEKALRGEHVLANN